MGDAILQTSAEKTGILLTSIARNGERVPGTAANGGAERYIGRIKVDLEVPPVVFQSKA